MLHRSLIVLVLFGIVSGMDLALGASAYIEWHDAVFTLLFTSDIAAFSHRKLVRRISGSRSVAFLAVSVISTSACLACSMALISVQHALQHWVQPVPDASIMTTLETYQEAMDDIGLLFVLVPLVITAVISIIQKRRPSGIWRAKRRISGIV